MVHDAARDEHARRGCRRVRRARALPGVVRSGQAHLGPRHQALVQVSRLDLLKVALAGVAAGLDARAVLASENAPARMTDVAALGNVTLLHITDPHAHLKPVFYREPDALIGVGDERGKPPFLTGAALLRAYGIAPGSVEAYAVSHVDF